MTFLPRRSVEGTLMLISPIWNSFNKKNFGHTACPLDKLHGCNFRRCLESSWCGHAEAPSSWEVRTGLRVGFVLMGGESDAALEPPGWEVRAVPARAALITGRPKSWSAAETNRPTLCGQGEAAEQDQDTTEGTEQSEVVLDARCG